MNTRVLSLVLAAALVAVVVLPPLFADEQPSNFEPVADVTSLMTGLGTAFSQIKDLAANPDEDRRLPRLHAWSQMAAELSNVNALLEPDQAYRDMAMTTRDIALELAQATQAETVDDAQLTSMVTRLDVSCSTCHDAD